MRQRQTCVTLALGAMLFAGCVNSQTGANETLSGTFQATIFTVSTNGQTPVDALAAGGSLRIVISVSGTTSGTLSLPASLTGGAPLTASMEGTAVINELTVRFNQAADSFVRSLIWSRQGSQLLLVDNQTVGGVAYTIALVRQ